MSPSNERCAVVMDILAYAVFINSGGFICSIILLRWISSSFLKEESFYSSSSGITPVSLLILVFTIPGFIVIFSVLSPMFVHSLYQQSQIRTFDKLVICIVTKGKNAEALYRTTSCISAQSLDRRVQIAVVADEGADLAHLPAAIQLVIVPKRFAPSKALHKARALEYFRIWSNFGPADWILHLDEETVVLPHSLEACISFIERTTYDYGQGIIFYNTVNHWRSYLLSSMEISRVRDDIGRFQFAHNLLHFPLHGFHGSFMLVRGVVENVVSWNTSNLTEDMWFAITASVHGFRGGFIPSIAHEQCCWSIVDVLHQRRRWWRGMLTLEYGLIGKLNFVLHAFSNLEPVFLVISLWKDIPAWLLGILRVYIGTGYFSLIFASVLQDIEANVELARLILHAAAIIPMSFAVVVFQFVALILTIASRTKQFEVVRKK